MAQRSWTCTGSNQNTHQQQHRSKPKSWFSRLQLQDFAPFSKREQWPTISAPSSIILFLLIQHKGQVWKSLPARRMWPVRLYSCQPVASNYDLISTFCAGATQEEKHLRLIWNLPCYKSLWLGKLQETYLTRQEAQDHKHLSLTHKLSHPGPCCYVTRGLPRSN